MTRITLRIAPGTSSSRVQSSGTWSSPSLRAATAGNSALRSSVAVNRQLTMRSGSRSLRLISSRIRSSVAATIAVTSFDPTVTAPRTAQSRCSSLIRSILPEPVDLGRAQPPGPTLGELPQRQGPEPHPPQLLDAVADRLDHPPDLAVAPLVDGDLDHPGRGRSHTPRRGGPVVQVDAAAQAADLLRRRRPGKANSVRARHLVARMGQALGQGAVVRQQDQAGGVHVK